MDIKQFVIHTVENGRFKIQFERSAVKNQDGFKVEVAGDDLELVKKEAEILLAYGIEKTRPVLAPEVKL